MQFSPPIPILFALRTLVLALLLVRLDNALSAPVGGVVSQGNAQIQQATGNTTITQSSANAILEWRSFSVGATEAVQFIQPGRQSVTVNQVMGSTPSRILGQLKANGQVFLVNPHGIVFGNGAVVEVGGLVASALNTTGVSMATGQYQFAGGGEVVNLGHITTPTGGFVVLMGAQVNNAGSIFTPLGSTHLAAVGNAHVTVGSTGFVNLAQLGGTAHSGVNNSGWIQADGGQVFLTSVADGLGGTSQVNHNGVIRAQTIDHRQGSIRLLGDMALGSVKLSGTLDASAPAGGNGGFIETSAAHVQVLKTARVTTSAPFGTSGNWLIDPNDFIIAREGDLNADALVKQLTDTDITISSVNGQSEGKGDVVVNQAISWETPHTLTLNAVNDVNINAPIRSKGGNLVLWAGHDINLNPKDAMVTLQGKVTMSAGRNGTPGTVNFSKMESLWQVEGPNASVQVSTLLPSSGEATNYAPYFDLTRGAALMQMVSFQGLTGATGATGDVGATGAVGAVGPTGASGHDGATGPAGATGAVGAVGATGTAGSAGPAGATGSVGGTGPSGAEGTAGAAGPAGPTGLSGSDGAQGVNGLDGATGPAGATGATGTTGTASATGPSGAVGPSGRDGSTGATGATGKTGSEGASNVFDVGEMGALTDSAEDLTPPTNLAQPPSFADTAAEPLSSPSEDALGIPDASSPPLEETDETR